LEKWPKQFFQQFHTVAVDECLHPDSMITMADGKKKKISDIKIGEFVKTINEKTSQIENKEVEKIHKNISFGERVFELELENGSILRITGNHKVLTKDKIWKRVDELNINDDIIEVEN
jgi:intein/homing endonuclease